MYINKLVSQLLNWVFTLLLWLIYFYGFSGSGIDLECLRTINPITDPMLQIKINPTDAKIGSHSGEAVDIS